VTRLLLDVKSAEFLPTPTNVSVDSRGRDTMEYNVVATVRAMPISLEVDREKLKKDIGEVMPHGMKVHKIEEEPIAFGLVALRVFVLLNDAEGGTEDIEKKIKELDDVSEVDLIDARRLL
jgi:elongation factor 1-beta